MSRVEKRVRPGKDGKPGETRWRARLSLPEGRERAKLFTRKADAERWLAVEQAKVVSGTWVDPALQRVTFADWCDEYFEAVTKRPTTEARDRNVLKVWWTPALGRMPLGKITPLDVRRVVDKMAATLAPKTVSTNYGVGRAVFGAAVEGGKLTVSPCRGIRLPKLRPKEQRFLDIEELLRLADAMPVEYRPVVWLGGVLGLRLSEIAGLKVGRVNFLRRSLIVTATVAEVQGRLLEDSDVKSRASRRTMSVPGFVVEELAAHLQRTGRSGPEDYVVQAPEGGPLRASMFRPRVWQPAVRRAGLVGLTIHQLRHTAAGLLIAEGAHAKVIQARLGHASIRTTMDVYGSVLPEVDQGAADLLDRALRASGPNRVRRLAAGQNDADPAAGMGSDLGLSGGGERIRTADFYVANVAL